MKHKQNLQTLTELFVILANKYPFEANIYIGPSTNLEDLITLSIRRVR